MVIKIQTQEVGIPVEIGELKFTFDSSDESIKRFYEAGQKFVEEIEATTENDLETTKEIVKKGYDLILGEGAFEKIYEQTPSLIRTIDIFGQLSQEITNKLNALGKNVTQLAKAQQYIGKNKPHHNKRKNHKK